jgi:hypothetical protein
MFQINVVEKIKTDFVTNNLFFFSENRVFMGECGKILKSGADHR